MTDIPTDNNLIQEALKNLQIEELNSMQKASLRANSEKKDIILLSPTGSGKTLAYLLPLLREIKKGSNKIEVIILVPSRELAIQIESVIKIMDIGLQAISCYGGKPAADERKKIENIHPSIIIGTPGRMNDHLSKGNFDVIAVTTLIIDEFDKSLEFGFQEEMEEVIRKLPNLKRRILISATDAEEIPLFTGMKETVKLNFLDPKISTARLHLMKVISPDKDKLETLYKLLCTLDNQSTLVFCNHRESVERVNKFLRDKRMYNEMFHGGMEQCEREKALYKFRNGSCPILISTDLASRGLDIPEIKHIIHYHLPINEESYIHRNGRTARWEATGNSYLLLHSEEQLPEYIRIKPEIFNLPANPPKPSPPAWVTLYIGKGKKDKVNKIDIVGLLFKKGNLNKDDIGKIDVKDHYAFVTIRRKRLKQVLCLIQGEKIKGIKTLIEEAK